MAALGGPASQLVAGALGWRYEDEAPISGGSAALLLERDGARIGIQVIIP